MQDDGHIMDFSQITDNIFIGSDLCKGNICPIHGSEFKELGVTVELNLSMEKKEVPPDNMDAYVWLPVQNNSSPNEAQFAIGTNVINEAVLKNKKVFLHCKNGHGRSPTMLAAYLIRFENLNIDEAIAKIQGARPEIHILENQMNALKEFQEKYKK